MRRSPRSTPAQFPAPSGRTVPRSLKDRRALEEGSWNPGAGNVELRRPVLRLPDRARPLSSDHLRGILAVALDHALEGVVDACFLYGRRQYRSAKDEQEQTDHGNGGPAEATRKTDGQRNPVGEAEPREQESRESRHQQEAREHSGREPPGIS